MEKRYNNIHQKTIDRCRNGDQKAQAELYKLYYKSMYNVSLRIVQDEMEAEDVMQESFLKAFSKLNTYKGEVSFGAWLKKIVVNRSLDILKKRKVKFEEINERTHDKIETQTVSQKVDMDKIKKAVYSLPDGYRVVLSLFLFEGYDHSEISEVLGISNSASRTQYLRAKNKLREMLNREEVLSYN